MAQHQLDIIFDEDLSPKGSKIQVGIHTNCDVVSLEKTAEYIDINFKDSTGNTNNKRLWAPKGNYPLKDESIEEAKTREERENLGHLAKLVHIFLGKEAMAKFSGEYDVLTSNIITSLRPKLSSKKVNLKLIYDADGAYPVFGRYPDYVEECVTGQEPTLQFSNWEKQHRLTRKAEVKGKHVTDSNDSDLDDILG